MIIEGQMKNSSNKDILSPTDLIESDIEQVDKREEKS